MLTRVRTRLAATAVIAVAALLLATPVTASAYVVPMSIPDLVELSDTIVEVDVRSAEARPERARGRLVHIDTAIDFQVTRVHKGRDRGSITLMQPGGEAEGYTLAVPDLPEFEPGERAIVFLDATGVVGGWQGKLDIVGGRVPALGLSVAEVRRAIRDLVRKGETAVPLSGGHAMANGEVATGDLGEGASLASGGSVVTLLNSTFDAGNTSGWTMSGNPTWAATAFRAKDGSGSLYGSGGGAAGRAAPGPLELPRFR